MPNRFRYTGSRSFTEVVIAIRRNGYRAWGELDMGEHVIFTDASLVGIGLIFGNNLDFTRVS